MDERVVATGRIVLPRAAWVLAALAALMLVGGGYLAIRGEPMLSLYPLAGAAGFGLCAVLGWLRSGTLQVTTARVRWSLRNGTEHVVALADVSDVQVAGSRRAGNLHIVLQRRDGTLVPIHRVHPLELAGAIRDLLPTRPPPPPEDVEGYHDTAGRYLPVTKPASWNWAAWYALWVVGGAAAAAVGHANGWLALNLLLLPILWAAAVLAHELGHAAAARLCGFDVHWLRLGTGPVLLTFQVAGVLVTLSAIPFSGAVFCTTSRRPGYRRRRAVISAAGPFVNVVALAASLVALHFVGWRDFTRTPAPLELVAFANLLCHLGTAVNDDGVATDVKHLQAVSRASEADLEAMFEADAAQNARWR